MTIARSVLLAVVALRLLAAPHTAESQPAGKVARVGVLLYGTPNIDPNFPAFRDGLRDLGYVEGRNLTFEHRFADRKGERLAGLAAELVKREPHVIFVLGGDVAPFARAATSTIPICTRSKHAPPQTSKARSRPRQRHASKRSSSCPPAS